MLTPVILSGGAGTRLWPLSRELYPKQLLALTGERTILQQTALRVRGSRRRPPPARLHRRAPVPRPPPAPERQDGAALPRTRAGGAQRRPCDRARRARGPQ